MWRSSRVDPLTYYVSLYMLPLGLRLDSCGVSNNCYANDTQLYFSLNPDNLNLITFH